MLQITVPLIGKMSDYPRRYVTPLGVLHVRLDRAELARGADFSLTGKASADPYACMRLTSGETQKSTVKPTTLSPQWNEYFELQLYDPQVQSLHFKARPVVWVSVSQLQSNPPKLICAGAHMNCFACR